MTALFLCDKVTFTEGDYLKNYYVINCFDGVPILEFILNQIINNAIKYGAEGKLIRVEAEKENELPHKY